MPGKYLDDTLPGRLWDLQVGLRKSPARNPGEPSWLLGQSPQRQARGSDGPTPYKTDPQVLTVARG